MTAVSSGLTLAIYWIGAHLIEDVKIPTDPTKIADAMKMCIRDSVMSI